MGGYLHQCGLVRDHKLVRKEKDWGPFMRAKDWQSLIVASHEDDE